MSNAQKTLKSMKANSNALHTALSRLSIFNQDNCSPWVKFESKKAVSKIELTKNEAGA